MKPEKYVGGDEYPNYFVKLEGLRERIASRLPLHPGFKVLDFATGSAYFALAVAREFPGVEVTGVDVSGTSVATAEENIRKAQEGRVRVLRMDAAELRFPDSTFDATVNFLGLEDIHMTRGAEGVRRALAEAARVLKPGGWLCYTVMPPEEAETPSQRLECEVFSYICGAKWLQMQEYLEMTRAAGLSFVDRETFYTGRKLTAEQAREEIAFACTQVPVIYGVATRPFEEAWGRFGREIEENGMGQYSRVVLVSCLKTR